MAQPKRILRVTVRYKVDTDPDTSYLEQPEFERRLQEFQDGYFYYVGILAEAEIGIPSGPATSTIQRISSGGLWGIESDTYKGELESIEKEQLSDLRVQLKTIGFNSRAISAAFKNVERKGE